MLIAIAALNEHLKGVEDSGSILDGYPGSCRINAPRVL